MLTVAYNDESADQRAFVVSGLLGLLPEWVELERLWRRKLAKLGLSEFHSAQCEQRRGPFESYERDTRDLFQREFYGLVARMPLWGFCTAVWQRAYNDRWSDFEAHRSGTEGNFTHPYFLAFQHNIEAMCLAMDRGNFPTNEPIAFVFDQQWEFEGRAKKLYDSLRSSLRGRLTYQHRLGGIWFDSRFSQIQLQAADIWAYESRKFVTDVLIDKRPEGQRWQYETLRSTGRFQVWGFPPESLDRLSALMREDPDAASSLARLPGSGDAS